MSFVNKFISVVFQQFSQNTEAKILSKTATVYGKLLRLGGTKIAQIMEQNVKETVRWLKQENQKDMKKFAAILALQELLIEAQYITFNILFMTDGYFMLISNLIRNKNQMLRKATLNFFDVCIKLISQRELLLQKDWLHKFYSEIKRTLNNKDDEVIHGNILAIKVLLTYSQQDIFQKDIKEMSQYIFTKKDSKNPIIQEAVIETIPTIAKYGNNQQRFLDDCITYLKTFSKQTQIKSQKSLCYSTLSEIYSYLSENQIKLSVKDVIRNLLDELQINKKQFCIQIIICLESILEKLGKAITEYADIQILIDSILLNGLYPQSVKFLMKVSKLNIDDVAEYIQCKLLLAISVILIKKHYQFQHPVQLDKMLIERFQQNLSEAIKNSEFRTDEGIAMAIQTLSTFFFQAYQEDLARFVKDCVLGYLDDTNSTIRKAAAQAGCLLYVKKGRSQLISKNIMYEILEKFMSVALSDPEKEIRQTMLQSLNENFDIYLNSPNYLRKLFLCVNDTDNKVQELALKILCRLAKYNPSDIIPFLKRTLFQYLSSLTFQDNIQRESQKIIELINLLTCLIKYGSLIVKPHSEIIGNVLLKHLKDPNVSAHLLPSLFRSLSQLSAIGDPQMMLYLDQTIPIILQSMQDKSYTVKRESAVKALVDICKNTGYVVLPYYRYPQLQEIILSLMRNETNQEMRNDCLRLIGSLGAIDNFYYRRVLVKLNKSNQFLSAESKMQSLNQIINQTLKRKFKSIENYKQALKNKGKNNLGVELHKYYEDLILLGNFKQQKNMFLYMANIEKLSQVSDNNMKQGNNVFEEQEQNGENIEQMLTSPTEIQLNNSDYYSTIIIKTLLKILTDSSLRPQHDLAIDTIVCILGTLKSRTANFLHLIIPVFKKIIKIDDLRDKLLVMIEKVIKHCQMYFDVEYIDSIIDIFLQNASDPKSTGICFDIMITLISCQKNHLKNKIEPLIREINSIINRNEENKELIKKGLGIYYILGELLDSYLHMIIPFLCELIKKEHNSIDVEIRREILILLVCLVRSCSSTVQSLSLIVDSLLTVLKNCYLSSPQTVALIMSCFVVFINKYRNSFLVYLPLINNIVNKYKIAHTNYNQCIEILLTYGNLDENPNLNWDKEDNLDAHIQVLNQKYQQPAYVIEPKDTTIFMKIEASTIIYEFDTMQKTLKEDWVEWMRKSSVEILKQSPNLLLKPCHSIAEVYPELSTELYNIAFACLWGVLNDKQKEFIINQLNRAINPNTNENIPINILQTILNLAEFMSHDKEGLQIDNSTLGNLAEKCLASAKALYYREHEFETASEKTIESLITLYTNLGQKEAAAGLLTYAKNNLNIDLKLSWFENLQRWEKALEEYRIKQLNNQEDEYFLPKMRCQNALSDFQVVVDQCDHLLEKEGEENNEKIKSVMHLAANAAMNLGYWDKLQKYVQYIDDSQDKNFWQAAINIHNNKFEDSKVCINKAICKLDSQVSGLLLESHSRAYDSLLRLQQLFEMEEILELKEFEESVENTGKESKGELKNEMEQEYQRKKQNLQDTWNDRLNGNPKDIDTWQKVLSVRGLLLTKAENIETWLKFSRLAQKQNQIQLSKRTLEKLKQEIKNEENYPPKLVLANFECEYHMGIIQEQELCQKVKLFLLNNDHHVDSRLKAKMFMKLGKFLQENKSYDINDSKSFSDFEQINNLYKQSLEFNPDYHKTWHSYALINFDSAKQYQNEEQKSLISENHMLAALKGFIKSIALGYQAEHTSKFLLQDSLRLLTIIFQYGTNEAIASEFNQNFKTIDIRVWIEVVPQIIARISIPSITIQNMLIELLIRINSQHPQALVYPLTVACKSKIDIRNKAAQVILDDMKKNSPILVEQAMSISDELNRTAILLKELWHDGIEEAWKNYSTEKNTKNVIKILQGLHEIMKNPPQSLSEIAFHQQFGADLKEAEAWLERFIQTDYEMCLCQSFDIYYQIYREINQKLDFLKMVHLENVSPKLLSTKNCEISIPGLYKPNKPIIRISCFQPKLPVLTSKQHPRKIYIYGSDNKEYLFLLKGREDLRQDERVMQLFKLVNRLLHNNPETEKKDLLITRFSVIPLSTLTGLIGWVQDCDTLQLLIREYRETYNIRPTTEMNLRHQFCANYDQLPMPNKVEIFRYILENTKGEDLQKVLWLKSPNSETWLERRTNYIRSLATMSIVGYILGLGDRHPSNIMLQRYTGKIVHIDFGDCFEVAMKRERYPERVPFRLTRMLVNAMEACGIEGNYRNTCELVMQVVHTNKESLLAVLEAFVYDPLINWRLLTVSTDQNMEENKQEQQNVGYVGSVMMKGASVYLKNKIDKKLKRNNSKMSNAIEFQEEQLNRNETSRQKELQTQFMNEERQDIQPKQEILNKKALEVMDRIKKKLMSRDFIKENGSFSVNQQVKKLIDQAMSHENICQAFSGWCPFW